MENTGIERVISQSKCSIIKPIRRCKSRSKNHIYF